ncbi:hypothetical protein SAMN05192529_108103 [Arachidicoccus rhizosphaerae]|uniref:DUF4870 domain-containing protein n=1 Tax=Arachidicoccus rhizosphaerae TaxID=551991 RepID=A0A1H3YJE7_9BACT|nr:DUF4870 domain-containing protein [Arachidicoccus rhizosphaerae]SEA11331.1 hypothetical protein SAMN05192529_108103 [Arachidicoccus rhizosphaerae]
MENSSILGHDTQPATPPTQDEKTLGLLAHIITFISAFLGPLIIYLVKKDESSFVSEHAKESLNFQITLAIVSIILFISIVGILLLWVIGIIDVVLVVVATIKASEGKLYRYPFALRLIK